MSRSVITSAVLGAVVGSVPAAGVLFARADGPTSTVSIDNFSFGPQTLTVKAGTTWTNKDDIPHSIASSNNAFKKSQALDTDEKRLNHLYLRYLKPPRPQRRLDARLVPIGGL